MSREVELSRSHDAHFVTWAHVNECDGDVFITRTVVVVGRSGGPSEVCRQMMSMSRADWLVVLPLLHAALGVESEVRA